MQTQPWNLKITNPRAHEKLFFVLGVVLPLAAVSFEAATHFCAQHFFDPFPSISHIFLFLLIPLSNFLVFLAVRKDLSEHFAFITLATGMAAGVAVMYSLMFLPILGLSLVFALAVIGLFGLTPLINVGCLMRSGEILNGIASSRTYFDPHQVKHIGHLIILVMVIALELPSTLTRIHLEMADNAQTAINGIEWLRKYGNQEVMLRACYERSGRATDILGSLYQCAKPLSVESARNIFYRVTGKPFNSIPIPAAARATITHAGLQRDVASLNAQVEDEFDLDKDIAGETVSGESRGLSGRNFISGGIDARSLSANLTWSVVLNNTSKYDREARVKLRLPKNAVVTRAQLVDASSTREAIIMTRGKARIQYVQAVTKHQDPLLVSMSGPDEVLVQCFPVEPNKSLTIRLVMACPMNAVSDSDATLELPVVAEKNFKVVGSTKLLILGAPCGQQIDGSKQIELGDDPVTTAETQVGISNGMDVVNGRLTIQMSTELTEDQLHSLTYGIRTSCERSPQIACKDAFTSENAIIQENLQRETYPLPTRITVVLDGSQCMKTYADELFEALKSIPNATHTTLVMIRDPSNYSAKSDTQIQPTSFAASLDASRTTTFIGGQDDSAALLSELQNASKTPGNAVLWIHGAQPVANINVSDLKRVLQQGSVSPLLYDFEVEAGPVACTNGILSHPGLVRVPRIGNITADLNNLFSSWKADWQPTPRWSRASTEGALLNKHNTLAQLYAYDQILQYTASDVTSASAVELAKMYHVVGPVSSAIVRPTENSDEQRVATGIGPEADTWLLLVVVGCLLFAHFKDQQRKLREQI